MLPNKIAYNINPINILVISQNFVHQEFGDHSTGVILLLQVVPIDIIWWYSARWMESTRNLRWLVTFIFEGLDGNSYKIIIPLGAFIQGPLFVVGFFIAWDPEDVEFLTWQFKTPKKRNVGVLKSESVVTQSSDFLWPMDYSP